MRIAIDRTRPLHAQPGTGHNRWHPAIPPLARVAPGETITLETRDGLDGQLTADSTADDLAGARFGLSHPLTGPIFVEGAEPGDLLEVEILGYEHRGIGVTAFLPGFGFLADVFTEPYLVVWELDERRAHARAAGRRDSRRALRGRPRRGALAGRARAGPQPRAGAGRPRRARRRGRAGGRLPARGGGRAADDPAARDRRQPRRPPARRRLEAFLAVEVPGALFSAGDLHFAQGTARSAAARSRSRARSPCASALRKQPAWLPRFPAFETPAVAGPRVVRDDGHPAHRRRRERVARRQPWPPGGRCWS